MQTFLLNHFLLTTRKLTAILALFLMVLLNSTSLVFAADPIKLEAEATQGVALNGVQIVQDQPGYSGTGYAWGFDDDSNGGDNMVFTFSAPAGSYQLTIGYYSPYDDKKTRLTVNGSTSEQDLKATGTNFGAAVIGSFQLLNGQNTITINKNWGYYGIDFIVLTPASVKPPTVVPLVNGRAEAEAGDLTGVDVASAASGFSGTGYVTGLDNATDQVSITFNATAGLYDLSIGYASPNGDKGIDFQVNEEKGNATLTETLSGYRSSNVGKFLLTAGLNTITIYRGWGYFDIDYIQLTPTTPSLPIKPPKILVDAQATLSTKGLFSYLVDQYGSKVLSGQQDDVEYVLEKTGKEPAIGSFDLIDYSPSRVQFGTTPIRSSEAIIDWAKKGEGRGIISLMWHWNAPTDLINQAPDQLWWRGFYTEATTFDLAAALADKNSTRYQLLLSDIDAIALQLKKFQAADVPVLWRPLHEAPGGWFWWGAKGAGPFKDLWQLMYNRLTNYHQLHNLIWVYTGTDTINPDWYPGDQYVDVVGEDIYADPTANLSGNWANAQAQFNGKKLVALTETGNLPNPDKIRGFATWWSWFAVWTGTDYIKKQPIDLLKAVFMDEDVITRDELPDWRPIVTLKVQYQDADKGNATNTTIRPNLMLINEGSTPVPYSELTVRYWFTAENYAGINAYVDYAQVGGNKIKTRYVALPYPRNGATGYLEYSFDPSAGNLAVGNSGLIQSRFVNSDYKNLSEKDDYSYQAATTFVINNHITLYRTSSDGVAQLIWGIEPDVVPSVVKLKALTQNRNSATNNGSINTFMSIVNEGNVPVSYGDLSVRYWFTAEGTQNLNFFMDYAKLGNANVTGQFMRNMGRSKSDTYLQLNVKPTVGMLYPASNTGDIQYRIAKADWSTFNEDNDYSYKPTAAMDTNSHVTIYYRDQLVFGAEPAVLSSSRLAAEENTTPLQVSVLGNPVVGENAQMYIQGAAGAAVWMTLTTINGATVLEKKVDQAAQIEHHVLPLGKRPGIYLLRVNTLNESLTVKIIKP
ncbi:glycosyl hydrolase [Spirosoma utsteinense]|uniref:Mannan endo-1,4-beta-mannosidase n=1 Tax=Spirosoma utsteinense TaxID=2585773 RepID=A0ABR6WC73_9BACT|nr:glycosyl hydrolase [Spirosoma utsteinense]MBC3783893.1 mannan endo-1,4-beta-mannosidase [Spirosoma utsteinense]MBC3793527.1 mannan endo-1,4-beta-mannosidase [Spirosoma utsteinense]